MRSTKLKQSINAIWTSLDYICRMNLPALYGELASKSKLKFRRKYNNKPSLSIFFSFAILESEAPLSQTTHIKIHFDHWPQEVSLSFFIFYFWIIISGYNIVIRYLYHLWSYHPKKIKHPSDTIHVFKNIDYIFYAIIFNPMTIL